MDGMNRRVRSGVITLFINILVSICWTSFDAKAASLPGLMAVIGDSISAATFAHTSALRDEPGLMIPGAELGVFAELSRSPTRSQAHSQTRAEDPIDPEDFEPEPEDWHSIMDNKETLSWASGREIRSHWARLHQMVQFQKAGLEVFNAAISGGRTKVLQREIQALAEEMQSGKYASIPYLTFLMGSNDLCHDTPPEEVQQNVARAFDEIAAIQPGEKIRVFMSSVPQIPQLGRPEISQRETILGYSCEYVRSHLLRFCNRMTHWRSEAEYQERVNEVDRLNVLLLSTALEAQRRHPNLDVAWSGSFAQDKVDFSNLAVDCFHPNARGQERLAEMFWADQPWFR